MLIQRPPEFFSKFVVDLRDNSFKIRLNRNPVDLDKIKNSDFKISYKGQSIPIEEFRYFEDERRFRVCPNLKFQKATDAYEYLFTEQINAQISDLTYAYGDIRDSFGNKLDEWKFEYLHQYREFFVQETSPYSTSKDIIKDSLMKKMKPLGSKEQHFARKNGKNNYWMNTPLPNLKN